MNISHIPYDRSSRHWYPYDKHDIDNGIILDNEVTKNAVKAKLAVAKFRAERLDNSEYDRDPRKGVVDAWIPEHNDLFQSKVTENGDLYYKETKPEIKGGLMKKGKPYLSESLALSPDGRVDVEVTTKDKLGRSSQRFDFVIADENFLHHMTTKKGPDR